MAAIKGGHAPERTPPPSLARDLGGEPLHQIEPGGACRGKVKMEARVLGEPGLDRRMFVRAVVVEDEMNVLPARRLPIAARSRAWT
jgi:hypothetical protein